ncbi:cadherin domain protein [Dictyocaulus viviparus]|uniref:Cadherin domain protein n=1 Tax=Dictyocaulus viviparus TaxID=29172 RepID=A0A0D8XQ29_DICVI|nr:cadherin domain protein [Dictyocaulus viviparus]
MFIIARDHGDPPRESKAEVIVNIFGTLITVATGAPTNEDFEYVNSAEETSIRPDFNLPTITTSSSDRIGHSFTSFTSSLSVPTNGLVPVGQITHTNQGLGIPWTFPGTLPTKSTGRGTFELPTLTTNNNNTFNPFMPSSFTVAPPLFRLAPVFNPPKITVTVNENESNVEITKVHATYPDGEPGTITYILQKGDPTLFEVSPYSGAVTLLRPLDAESDTSYTLQISTKEASALAVDRLLAHFVLVTIHVGDVNDWIPKFENSNYNFNIHEGTTPGTIVGQVVAVDEDKENPNNRIRYRLLTAGGLENYFAVNSETGLITLAKDIDEFAGEKITLRIEASDSGIPAQSSITNVLFDIIPNTLTVTPSFIPYPSQPIKKTIQFTSRNYSVSVAESVRPPNLVHVLSIKNKPTDTRFISCNIVSGNHRGAFSVMAGTDGDCELRTQVELDRESMERYLLNITVTAGDQSDNTLVSITVVDVNDNAPRFIYNNDVGMRVYFAGISSTADASTKVLTVKAEDDDVGNNSLITYSIDPLSLHSKYFTVSPAGEISTTQSISDLPLKNQIDYFEIRVSACDSPISGQQLCSKAYVVINVITESNRFRITAVGLNPQQLQAHENIRTDMYLYAVDPDTKKICKKNEFRKLFESSSMAVVANKAQPWLQIEKIDEIVNEGTDDDEETLSNSWKTASILLIGFAALIAVGSLVGLCVVCLYWNRLKSTQRTVHSFNPHGRPQKLSTIFLPNAPSNTRFDKIYETQILEMPISDEDVTKNGTVVSGKSRSGANGYSNYGRNGSLTYEGDFSIEENMYALNTPGRIDPVTKRVQNLVIPAPDYPRTNRQANSHQKKSLL